MSAWTRILLVTAGGLALGLLGLAFILSPDARGLGTHQQLGLPPCTIRVLFGMRCPLCGMTTSWALLTEGRLLEAMQANAAGVLWGVVAAVGGVWSLVGGIAGRWCGFRFRDDYALYGLLALFAVTFADWLVRLGFAGS